MSKDFWVAAHLTEAVGELASSLRLRRAQAVLCTEWAITGPRTVQLLTDYLPRRAFKYLFSS
ncbi:hypothetical protein [Hymenobacter sp. PAMC 26628]|uniref:hypothetical protein n=1 Tax=Hymenobacter sp. PAMC 26628 TaxID=1484118 RepID=UPI000770442F|nr:hypothetical protein [Hymenobacter sp. PAMC 26628]AMJ64049.1 hypothetical protein AXW84_00340 [Hymenobacter sp. PAMC 26628]